MADEKEGPYAYKGDATERAPFRYLRHCNHADHPASQCKEKSVRGTPHPTVPDAIQFKRTSKAKRQKGT